METKQDRKRALRCAIVDCTRDARYRALLRLSVRELERDTVTDDEAARALNLSEGFALAAHESLTSRVILP